MKFSLYKFSSGLMNAEPFHRHMEEPSFAYRFRNGEAHLFDGLPPCDVNRKVSRKPLAVLPVTDIRTDGKVLFSGIADRKGLVQWVRFYPDRRQFPNNYIEGIVAPESEIDLWKGDCFNLAYSFHIRWDGE